MSLGFRHVLVARHDPQQGEVHVNPMVRAGVPTHNPVREDAHDERNTGNPAHVWVQMTSTTGGQSGADAVTSGFNTSPVLFPPRSRPVVGNAFGRPPCRPKVRMAPVDCPARRAGWAFLISGRGDPLPPAHTDPRRHPDLPDDPIDPPGEICGLCPPPRPLR